MYCKRTLQLALIVLMTMALTGCSFFCRFCSAPPTRTHLSPVMEGTAQGRYAYLWLASVKDAWVGCTASHCADADHNHGTEFSLDVAAPTIPPGLKRIYVEFYLPELPPGTRVEEAYINLYEDSRQVPGTGTRPVIRVLREWDPRKITWNDQPMAIGALSPPVARLGAFHDVNQWRGTFPNNDLPTVVQEHLAYPSRNHGFLINNPSNLTYLRSFRSNNARTRTETDMDFAPRLMLKVRLPGPEPHLDANNVSLPPLPNDTDLDEYLVGPNVLVVRVAGGNDWPAAWGVAVQ